MNTNNKYLCLLRGVAVAIVLIVVVTTSCTRTSTPPGSGQLSTSNAGRTFPNYKAGTVFVYSNGSWDIVESADNGLVQWLNHKGHRSTSSADFTYRPVAWESTHYLGERTFQQAQFLFSEMPTSLWPLAAGKTSGYVEVNRWRTKQGRERGYTAYWSCGVDGQEQVTVPAGSFAAWKVSCQRYSGSMRKNTAFAREYKTWYYSPKISHWVALERERKKSDGMVRKRQELVAILPPLDNIGLGSRGKKSLQQFYQDVLEKQLTGQQSEWKTKDGTIAMSMVPTKTFRRKNNMICRQYAQELEMAGVTNRYYGVACRNSEGNWSVPRKGR